MLSASPVSILPHREPIAPPGRQVGTCSYALCCWLSEPWRSMALCGGFGIPSLHRCFWRFVQVQAPLSSALSPTSAPCYITLLSIMYAPSCLVSEFSYASCLPHAVS